MAARMMIDHITVVAGDVAASARFYDRSLAPLGFARVLEMADKIGYGGPDGKPDFLIIPGEPLTTGVHVAFVARSRDAVEAFFEAAVAAGGRPRHEPREWPVYHPSYYGAFVDDPDGNNIEAVHHG